MRLSRIITLLRTVHQYWIHDGLDMYQEVHMSHTQFALDTEAHGGTYGYEDTSEYQLELSPNRTLHRYGDFSEIVIDRRCPVEVHQ